MGTQERGDYLREQLTNAGGSVLQGKLSQVSSLYVAFRVRARTENGPLGCRGSSCFPMVHILPEKQIVYHKLLSTEMFGVPKIYPRRREAVG